MLLLTLVQQVPVAAVPSWVGTTVALSLVVVAVSFAVIAGFIAVGISRLQAEAKRNEWVFDFLKNELVPAARSIHKLSEQGEELMVLVRSEAGAFVETGRRIRRKVNRGVDNLEQKLVDLETLYDVVHEEVETTALDVAAGLRRLRSGSGMINRVRRLVLSRR